MFKYEIEVKYKVTVESKHHIDFDSEVIHNVLSDLKFPLSGSSRHTRYDCTASIVDRKAGTPDELKTQEITQDSTRIEQCSDCGEIFDRKLANVTTFYDYHNDRDILYIECPSCNHTDRW